MLTVNLNGVGLAGSQYITLISHGNFLRAGTFSKVNILLNNKNTTKLFYNVDSGGLYIRNVESINCSNSLYGLDCTCLTNNPIFNTEVCAQKVWSSSSAVKYQNSASVEIKDSVALDALILTESSNLTFITSFRDASLPNITTKTLLRVDGELYVFLNHSTIPKNFVIFYHGGNFFGSFSNVHLRAIWRDGKSCRDLKGDISYKNNTIEISNFVCVNLLIPIWLIVIIAVASFLGCCLFWVIVVLVRRYKDYQKEKKQNFDFQELQKMSVATKKKKTQSREYAPHKDEEFSEKTEELKESDDSTSQSEKEVNQKKSKRNKKKFRKSKSFHGKVGLEDFESNYNRFNENSPRTTSRYSERAHVFPYHRNRRNSSKINEMEFEKNRIDLPTLKKNNTGNKFNTFSNNDFYNKKKKKLVRSKDVEFLDGESPLPKKKHSKLFSKEDLYREVSSSEEEDLFKGIKRKKYVEREWRTDFVDKQSGSHPSKGGSFDKKKFSSYRKKDELPSSKNALEFKDARHEKSLSRNSVGGNVVSLKLDSDVEEEPKAEKLETLKERKEDVEFLEKSTEDSYEISYEKGDFDFTFASEKVENNNAPEIVLPKKIQNRTKRVLPKKEKNTDVDEESIEHYITSIDSDN